MVEFSYDTESSEVVSRRYWELSNMIFEEYEKKFPGLTWIGPKEALWLLLHGEKLEAIYHE